MSQPQTIQQVAELLKVLAHPMRLAIILRLHEQGSLPVAALQSQLGLEQSLLSHHLIKLRTNRILSGQRRGKTVIYTLADSSLVPVLYRLLDDRPPA